MIAASTFTSVLWRRILTQSPFGIVSIDAERLLIVVAGHRSELEIEPRMELRVEARWFGSVIHVLRGAETIVSLGGFRPADATAAAQLLRERKLNLLRNSLLKWNSELQSLTADGKSHWGAKGYLRNSTWSKWRERAQQFGWLADFGPERGLIPEELRKVLGDFCSLLHYGPKDLGRRNRVFLEEERARYRALMTNHKGQLLTDEQQAAIVTDEDNTLVVAAAGSGKTSVIEAKFRYLVKSGRARPEEILLLAYNAKAREEIEERLKTPTAVVRTFHALGSEILAEVHNKKQAVSRLAEDSLALIGFVQNAINSSLERGEALIDFLVKYFYPPIDDLLHASASDYVKAMREADLRSMKGEKVKSFGELIIANLLTTYGIPYAYEPDYAFATATKSKRGYRPDFEIDGKAFGLEGKYYIEYFGINERGGTRRDINSSEYQKEMQWKRELHREHQTRLIEVFYYQLRDGNLVEVLLAALRNHGFPTRRLSPEGLTALLSQEGGYISRLAEMIATFIRLFKGGVEDLDGLHHRAERETSAAGRRKAAFIKVFQNVLKDYEEELARADEIDFEDMIRKATTCVRSGQYLPPYRYILVDEFQDISPARAALVTALRDAVPSSALMCVGDDWQSIYRFAGSQIRLMEDFSGVFGTSERVDLTMTHRFPQELATAMTQFITRNPSQLKKDVRSSRKTGQRPVHLVYENRPGDGLGDAIKVLKQRLPNGGSVLLLGRYNRLCPRGHESPESLTKTHPGFTFKFMSVHRSKGLEYDAVILLGVNENYPSFPSNRSDDPIFGLVLGESDSYPHAEERRLFYVAMTRARHCVVVTTSKQGPSLFVEELIESGACDHAALHVHGERVQCPHCKVGNLVSRDGPTGSFYGCSSFPYCDFTQNVCAVCRRGVLIRDKPRPGVVSCSTTGCKNTADVCGQCRTGWMERRMGKYGPFFGCSNYPECTRTIDARKGRYR